MKKTVYLSAIAISSFILHSCIPKPDEGPDSTKPEAPIAKPYFVPSETMVAKFANTRGITVTQAPEVRMKFHFTGTVLTNDSHNTSQAQGVANATNSGELSGKQFAFLISSPEASKNHSEALLHHLSRHGVKLEQFEVIAAPTASSSPVAEDGAAPPVEVIMRRL